MLSENYVRNVYTSDNTNGSYLATGLCHRSQRKSEPQHKMRITMESVQGICELAIHFALAKQALNHFYYYYGHKRWRTRNFGGGFKQPCLNE